VLITRSQGAIAGPAGTVPPVSDPAVSQSIALQRDGCAALGSHLMAQLLDGVLTDYEQGGVTKSLLDGRSERPVHDAVPLRLLGGVHRLVLGGEAPDLARFYPSVGGTDRGDPVPALLDTVRRYSDQLEIDMGETVQTNEVGRAALLAGGFATIARRTGLPLRLLEVGASGGLLLRWDRYWYDTGRTTLGDPASELQFLGSWTDPPPDLRGPVSVASRRGCDIAPIDAATPEGQRRLLSFVWPDQDARLARLRAALRIAQDVPVLVDERDAGDWVTEQLRTPVQGVATVVYHSIVLQYLPRASFLRMREAMTAAGAGATRTAPVAWLRMEPAGPVADLRLRLWPGGDDEVLATAGYHGQHVTWQAAS